MLISQFVDLFIISGPDEGMHYVVELDSFRVFGRYDLDSHPTQALSEDGDIALNPDQQERVNQQTVPNPHGAFSSTVKRGPDILLSDKKVSRTHAMVLATKNMMCVCDLMSKNGTKL